MTNTPLSVLFVGNSFTFYNSIPVLFEAIAQSAGINVHVTGVTKGGAHLVWFNDPEHEISKNFTETLESGTVYDYAILQEQSVLPYKGYDEFCEGIDILCRRIREKSPDVRILLYETWGFHEDFGPLKEEGLSTREQEILLINAYNNAGEKFSLPVSYAGITLYHVYKDTDYNPFHKDLKHPSYVGSFASALTHFYTIFPGAAKDAVTFRGELDDVCFSSLSEIAYGIAHKKDAAADFIQSK